MKRFTLCFLLMLVILPLTAFGQLSAPDVEAVYGGRISWISAVPVSATETQVFISTESANSMFFATVDHSTTPPVFGAFESLPDLNADDGYGSQMRDFCLDENSGYLFARYNDKIVSASTSPGSLTILPAMGVMAFTVYDGRLFYTALNLSAGVDLHFGVIDSASGAFSEDAASPVTLASSWDPAVQLTHLEVHPVNHYVYYFLEGETPTVYKSGDTYDALNAATTFTKTTSGSLGSTYYTVYGIGPDGRLFAGGVMGEEPDHFKAVAYSDDDGASWDTVNTHMGGTSGQNFSFADADSGYYVYFGTAFSFYKGEANTWKGIGSMGFETHPNDGAVCVDPIDPQVVYFTTDQGIGASTDSGNTIFEIDEGVEAIQIKDMEMNDAKTTAWLASKSGIRKVTDYAGPAESWTTYYPNGDGSPYYCVAMVNEHPDTAFAGNVRLYKTEDGGATWSQVFTTETPEYGFTFWSFVSAVEVHPYSSDVVILGVNSPDEGVNGGIFVSEDGGTSWEQMDSDVYNTEVQDILIYPESEDSTTIYVACEYVHDGTNSSYGVKTITHGSTPGAVFHNDMIGESDGLITNFGAYDLDADSVGNVYVCGANSANEPRVYVKRPDSTYWEMLPTAGLPANGTATALTIGYDTNGNQAPYIAVGSDLYYLEDGGSKWQLAYSYPVGTEINMLYWDDLLVGTGTGLYGQKLNGTTDVSPEPAHLPANVVLRPNYPNPFNPTTAIEYRLSGTSHVTLTVYNTLGQKVKELVNQTQQAGSHRVTFDADGLASGVYIYRLTLNNRVSLTRKMLLMR